MKKITLTVGVILILLTGSFVWKTESFQKNFYPIKYWQGEVAKLEGDIGASRFAIRTIQIDLGKEAAIYPFEVMHTANIISHSKVDTKAAELLNEANNDEFRKRIANMNQSIVYLEESIKERKKELSLAEEMLDKSI